MRELVRDSWRRSEAAGVDADRSEAALVMERAEVTDYRSGHILSAVFPLLYDVLGRAAEDCGCVMAVGDHRGRLLWVSGRSEEMRKAERIRFVEGTDWSEEVTGTNAPGTAIRLGQPVQIGLREHFNVSYKDWTCFAAPILHPESQQVLGIVDLTGTEKLAVPQTMAMVRSAARMAEAEIGRLLAVGRLGGSRASESDDTLHLAGLGRPDLMVKWRGRSMRVRGRQGDIVAVLADHPDGLTADQLALEVYDGEMQPSTLRAQMTRLRAMLGDQLVQSRPYSFQVEVATDWSEVLQALRDGRTDQALRLYPGPLLPLSGAPGIQAARTRIERELTRSLLSSGSPDLLALATRATWAKDNLELWERHAQLLPPSSPLQAVVLKEVARLHAEYGITGPPLPNRLHRL